MKRIASVGGMQRLALRWRREGVRVALVPTMGYLHEGHMSLVRRARALAGREGRVVVSVYVNPTQFAPTEDLARYPRDMSRDLRLCRGAGVDVVFTPTDATMYPGRDSGGFSTYVVEERLGRGMEGASRSTHFRGVTTVVAKLFLLVQPDVAVFGAKDWQQAAVVRRMVKDLNFPLRIVVAPTVRERDGLAMSSRNAYLTESQRAVATVLSRSIRDARRMVRESGGKLSARSLARTVEGWVGREPEARLDYVAFFDPETLEPAEEVIPGVRMALAVQVGRTRLIDNGKI
ncbi:MAG: pantoate--beta-alanine ligase [Limisphaerales bacterium]